MERALNIEKKQITSKQRIADYGEVYTAKREVNAMLDLVKQETERIDSRLSPCRIFQNHGQMYDFTEI